MTRQPTKRIAGQTGYTLVELLTAVAIFGVLVAAGIPHIDTRRQDLNTVSKQIIGDFRFARARAITSGQHFAVEWDGTQNYEVQRLEEVAGAWQVSEVVKTGELPAHLHFYITAEGGSRVEFNTRGMMVSSPYVLWTTLWDFDRNGAHVISIWPSGQIYEEL